MKVKTEKPLSAIDTLLGEPTSLKDAGYRIAKIGEGTRNVAMYMVNNYPDFAADPKVNNHKEIRKDLGEGYKMLMHERKGQSYYIVSKDTGAWLKIANTLEPDWQAKVAKAKEEKREVHIVNIHVATGLSQQEFGRLKSEDPAQYEAIKDWRNQWRGYEHNRNSDLETAVRKYFKEQSGEKTTRVTMNFVDSANKVFDAWEKSVKVKQDRGDETADPVRFRMAREAFWKTYTK